MRLKLLNCLLAVGLGGALGACTSMSVSQSGPQASIPMPTPSGQSIPMPMPSGGSQGSQGSQGQSGSSGQSGGQQAGGSQSGDRKSVV